MSSQHIQHILAPVDFSGLAGVGLRWAVRLAECSGASVTALYADRFEPPPYFTEGALPSLQHQIGELKRQAETALAEFVRARVGTADVRTRVEEGLPADVIRRVAAELDAGLIVMGTHGRSGVNRLMLGSVTERVLREAETAVLVVRGEPSAADLGRILCPVNNSPAARRALSMATSLARCLKATVHVVHVKEPAGVDPIEDLCAWIPEEQRTLCTVTALPSGGDVAQEVVSLAASLPADLLVLGAGHRRFFDTTVLGANTIRILRHSPCPVLAVFGRA